MEQGWLARLLRCLLQAVYLIPTVYLAQVQPPNDMLCDRVGGECQNTYEDQCQDGDFQRGLCAGANYRHCCVLRHPRPNPRDAIAPHRMCYACAYSYDKGRSSGDPRCQDQFQAEGMTQVNCTGQCAKLWLKLGEGSYSLERRCHQHCHPSTTFKEYYATYCCWGELCNAAVIPQMHLNIAVLVALCSVMISVKFTKTRLLF